MNHNLKVVEINAGQFKSPKELIEAIQKVIAEEVGQRKEGGLTFANQEDKYVPENARFTQDEVRGIPGLTLRSLVEEPIRHPAPRGFRVIEEHPTLDIATIQSASGTTLFLVKGEAIEFPKHPAWVFEQLLILDTWEQVERFINEQFADETVKRPEDFKFAQWYELQAGGVWELLQVHNLPLLKAGEGIETFNQYMQESAAWEAENKDYRKVMFDDELFPYEVTV